MRRAGVFLAACTAMSLACGDPAAPGPDLSSMSGAWTGTHTITQVGSCTFSGSPAAVTLQWTVTDEGEITIATPSGTPWATGTITDDLQVTVSHTGTATCGGTPNTYTSTYTGTIQRDGSALTIELAATETWCPPSCTFLVEYALTKQ